jgi:hypothetical protein
VRNGNGLYTVDGVDSTGAERSQQWGVYWY